MIWMPRGRCALRQAARETGLNVTQTLEIDISVANMHADRWTAVGYIGVHTVFQRSGGLGAHRACACTTSTLACTLSTLACTISTLACSCMWCACRANA